MFRAGAESWQAGVDDNPRLIHMALYVRDACDLDVLGDPSIPPRLLGEVVDHASELTPEVHQSAGEQWFSWWQAIIALKGAQQLGTLQLPDNEIERLEALTAVHESLLDWPELDVLVDQQALREAVRVSYEDANRWQSERSRGTVRSRRMLDKFHQVAFRPIAESLVARLGVQPGRLRVGVLVLGVEGEWSSLVAPGVLLCSESIVVDPDRLPALVEGAFVSGLDAVEVPLPTYERKRRSLPASSLLEPLVLWSGPNIELVCERVIPYPGGFEIELRRTAGAPPPAVVPTEPALQLGRKGDPSKRSDNFAGLEVGLHFADGRGVLVTDLGGPDRDGEIVLSRFWRKEPDADTLWLWVMPLPPVGEVTLNVSWPTYGIESAAVEFEGGLVRPARAG